MATSGIGSTLDVNSIVSQLMAVEAKPLAALARKEASYQAKLSAYGSLSGALGNFQTALNGLSTPAKFQGVTATSADSAIFSGSASTDAVPGSYAVKVNQLAQAQTIASEGYASTSAALGDGKKTTLTFEFGAISGGKLDNGVYVSDAGSTPPAPAFAQDADQATKTVVIDSTNNSLQGIRDAINKAGIGVTATIVSDGSTTPNHLVLTSDKTGEKSSMRITVAREPGDPANTAISDLLTYNPAGTQNMKQSAAAQDTKLAVNGIDVTSATRTITGAIQGVTLNASKVGESVLTVARDTAAVETAVNGFVKAYNELEKTIKSVSSYNATTKEAGLLLGDSTVRAIQSDVRKMLSSTLTGTGGKLNNLTQLGVTFTKEGTLAVDSGKLKTAVANNFKDIAGMFASFGSTTDSLVGYVSSTNNTKPGSHLLRIDQVAAQGSIKGSAAPVDMTIVAGVNDQLAMSVDGVSATVTLAENTYTQNSLISQLQSAINGAYSNTDIKVSVTADINGKLSIVSDRFGSSSKVNVGGNGAANLFGTPVVSDGKDVKGTIGAIEASGSGKVLTGANGTAIEGLKLTIDGGALGDRGKVNFSQGFAFQLSGLVGNYVGTKGLINAQTTGLNASIKDIGKSQEAFNLKLVAMEKRYRAQFVALDTLLSGMNQTSTYLTQQLEQISNLSKQQ